MEVEKKRDMICFQVGNSIDMGWQGFFSLVLFFRVKRGSLWMLFGELV